MGQQMQLACKKMLDPVQPAGIPLPDGDKDVLQN